MSTQERQVKPFGGWAVVAAMGAVLVAGAGLIVAAAALGSWLAVIGAIVCGLVLVVMSGGFFVVQPNHARVLVLFGRYRGTVRRNGFSWANPLIRKRRISLRVQNLDSDVLKVNDAVGNPVEIAAVITWQVVDSARAMFDVEDYESFVHIQTETAVRHVASEYPYDEYEDDKPSLRANADVVTATLQAELQERLDVAGVTVIDTRLRRLAYAPEIAGEMLRRQQASAVVAARKRIVEGAVGMVKDALQQLDEEHIVELDEERKASMVSNLLVVLTSDRGVQPIVNAGTLYG